uniref:NF1 n=1 Tax=synthetic construct TaxID=32630 RepID=UPI001AA00CFE|nr:Chain A, NF1 [synthetic construct]
GDADKIMEQAKRQDPNAQVYKVTTPDEIEEAVRRIEKYGAQVVLIIYTSSGIVILVAVRDPSQADQILKEAKKQNPSATFVRLEGVSPDDLRRQVEDVWRGSLEHHHHHH